MEELVKYFEQLEVRLTEMQRRHAEAEERLAHIEQYLTATERKVEENEKRLNEIERLLIEIKHDLKQVELSAVNSAPVSIQPTPAIAPEHEEIEAEVNNAMAKHIEISAEEEDTIATDEETGLPELEVEFIEEEEQPKEELKEEPKEQPKEEVDEQQPNRPHPQQTLLDAAQQGDTLSSVVPKIEDLKKAISLGDRFLFQRELFSGNGELMNKTIDLLNNLSSLDAAESYIAKTFPAWDKESNAYMLFTNLLKRRW